MRCNDSNAKKFLVKQKCKKFLAFSSRSEVRFLVDSSSCSNNKSYKHQSRTSMGYRISSTECRPRIVAAATIRGTRTRTRITLTTVIGLALGLFGLYNYFTLLTAELRGCVYYCQHLTVIAVLLLCTLSIRH